MNDLYAIIKKNDLLYEVLIKLSSSRDEEFYLGAGAVAQTVWNRVFGYDPAFGIEDADIVYFNDDLSEASEDRVIERLSKELGDCSFRLDIKNQARVHVWYRHKFDSDMAPIRSIEDAVRRWPTTATSVAVRIADDDGLKIIAPFGIDDLCNGVVRPNKTQITREIYDDKVDKWLKKWPDLIVVPW